MNVESPFPTVLIVLDDDRLCDVLVRSLEDAGYAVLQASGTEDAIAIVRTHSRPIHLLVNDDNATSQAMAKKLKQYRRQMDVLSLNFSAKNRSTSIAVDHTLQQIREIVVPPNSMAESSETDKTAGRFLAKGA